MIIYHDQVGFTMEMHRWFNLVKSMSSINRINGLKDKKSHIIILKDAAKVFDNNLTYFHKSLRESRSGGSTLQHNKECI